MYNKQFNVNKNERRNTEEEIRPRILSTQSKELSRYFRVYSLAPTLFAPRYSTGELYTLEDLKIEAHFLL